jgi:SulP family sulfate permease
MIALARSGLLDEIGDERIFGNVDDALNHARRELGLPEEPPPPSAEPTVERERTPAKGIAAAEPELLAGALGTTSR